MYHNEEQTWENESEILDVDRYEDEEKENTAYQYYYYDDDPFVDEPYFEDYDGPEFD